MQSRTQKQTTAAELISKRTRRALQEYFVGTTLRTISQAFEDADIECDLSFVASESGQRRALVQQYYATLDFSRMADVRKFLAVYADALSVLEQGFTGGFFGENCKQEHERLLALISKDGFEYKDGRLAPRGKLLAAGRLREDAKKVDSPYLLQQIEHIENQIDNDPRLAIGTSKELVESVCKTILTDRGVSFDKKSDVVDLVKKTRDELKLAPSDIPDSAKAAETIRKLLGSLSTIAHSLAELRNSYGTGHGHDGRVKGLGPRHARLAAGAACVLAKFLFETHEDRSI